MALHLATEPDRTVHPVDIIEHIAAINDWNFERQDTDEISISVRGAWSDYHVSFNWMEDLESLHIASAFDLKVPEARRAEVKALISLVNEQLWIGHFDIWNHEGVIIFRNSHLLAGGADVSPQQCEALLRSATESCDLYYQAFQFVVWAGKSAAQALEGVLFETVGEA
jgi:hypothetical protein